MAYSTGLADGKAVLFHLQVCNQVASIDASLEFLAHPSRRVTGVFFVGSEPGIHHLAATSDGTGSVKFWEIYRDKSEPGNERKLHHSFYLLPSSDVLDSQDELGC